MEELLSEGNFFSCQVAQACSFNQKDAVLASHFGYVSEFGLKLDVHVNSSVDKNVNLQNFLTSPFLHDIFFFELST